MFTSCCPAWVKYLENENPKYLKNISTCKSPMEMVGAIFRDKYAEKDAQDGRTTYHIAIMPCTAKKMEAARPEFIHDGRPDVDLVLTTHEVIDMMQETGIQLNELELESPDLPFGLGSGAAVIYGTTGGVAEAVVRHCLPDKSKNALREISILGLRGDAPIKETTVTIGDTELKLAVVNGLANARKLLKRIDEGEAFYHLIEVMTCQGGCVGGAGQPYGLKATKEKRGDGLHQSDNAAMFKRAERNPIVVRMMAEYGEERCHRLLYELNGVRYAKHNEIPLRWAAAREANCGTTTPRTLTNTFAHDGYAAFEKGLWRCPTRTSAVRSSIPVCAAAAAQAFPRAESGTASAASPRARSMWSATATRATPARLWTAPSWRAIPIRSLRA